MGPAAIPDIRLGERPALNPFSRNEFNKIPITAHGKILKYLADVQAYEDQADLAIQGYRDYLTTLFGGDKAKKKAPSGW